jgi:predicted nicotinamide N-methyase
MISSIAATGNVSMSSSDDEVSPFDQEEQEFLHVQCKQVTMTLRQFGSADPNWGIHSSVWDGGLALARYLELSESDLVIDMGSGTGIVGISCAAQGATAYLTDMEDALPLLRENVEINSSLWNGRRKPECVKLDWFAPLNEHWLQRVRQEVRQCSRIIVSGADVVYRASLFRPLLITVKRLIVEFSDSSLECWFACQSIRSHFAEFAAMAADIGFLIRVKAIVVLPDDSRLDLHTAGVEECDLDFPPESEPKKLGRVWILSLALS